MEQELDNLDNPEYVADNDNSEIAIEAADPIETQARSMGWVPLEEFPGDPDKWSEAEAFVERHTKHNGVLKKSNDALLKQVTELQEQVRAVEAMNKSVFDLQVKKMKEEHDNQIAFLKAQKRQARQAGDLDTADEIDEQIDALQERGPETIEPPPAPKAQDPNAWRQNPTMAAWADQNPWFEKDRAMSAFAVVEGQRLKAENPNWSLDDILPEVSKAVRKEFAHKFTSRRNPVEGAAASGGAVSSSGPRRGYNTLPMDAKRQCDMEVASGVFGKDEGKARAQWAALYYDYEDRRKK